jgi:hypothetical protein
MVATELGISRHLGCNTSDRPTLVRQLFAPLEHAQLNDDRRNAQRRRHTRHDVDLLTLRAETGLLWHDINAFVKYD